MSEELRALTLGNKSNDALGHDWRPVEIASREFLPFLTLGDFQSVDKSVSTVVRPVLKHKDNNAKSFGEGGTLSLFPTDAVITDTVKFEFNRKGKQKTFFYLTASEEFLDDAGGAEELFRLAEAAMRSSVERNISNSIGFDIDAGTLLPKIAAAAAQPTIAEVRKVMDLVDAKSHASSSWIVSHAKFWEKWGSLLDSPFGGNLPQGAVGTLLGRPVYVARDLASVGASSAFYGDVFSSVKGAIWPIQRTVSYAQAANGRVILHLTNYHDYYIKALGNGSCAGLTYTN